MFKINRKGWMELIVTIKKLRLKSFKKLLGKPPF